MKHIILLTFTFFIGFSISTAQNITIKKILELDTVPAVEVTKFLKINSWVYRQTNRGFLGKENAHVYSLKEDINQNIFRIIILIILFALFTYSILKSANNLIY